MDLMFMIISWLKDIIERLKNITSFISGTFLPSPDDEYYDDDLPVIIDPKLP